MILGPQKDILTSVLPYLVGLHNNGIHMGYPQYRSIKKVVMLKLYYLVLVFACVFLGSDRTSKQTRPGSCLQSQTQRLQNPRVRAFYKARS